MDYSIYTTAAHCDEEIALSQNNAGNIWNAELLRDHNRHIAAVWNRKAEILGWNHRMLVS